MIPLYEFVPFTGEICFIQDSSTLIGQVQIGASSYIGNNCVFRGDLNNIQLGENSFVFDNCSFQSLHRVQKTNENGNIEIGDRVTIMSNCSLVACFIDRDTIISANCVIGEGSRIGEHSIIGPNSVLPPNTVIPENQIWVGNPIKFVRQIEKSDMIDGQDRVFSLELILRNLPFYQKIESNAYLANERHNQLQCEIIK